MNGWSNRETWVTNLHLGEYLQEISEDWWALNRNSISHRRELTSELAEYLEAATEEVYSEDLDSLSKHSFFWDLFSFSSINWWELADHYLCDLIAEIEEDEHQEEASE